MKSTITKTIQEVIEELKHPHLNTTWLGKEKNKSNISHLIGFGIHYADKNNLQFIQFVEPNFYVFCNHNA